MKRCEMDKGPAVYLCQNFIPAELMTSVAIVCRVLLYICLGWKKLLLFKDLSKRPWKAIELIKWE